MTNHAETILKSDIIDRAARHGLFYNVSKNKSDYILEQEKKSFGDGAFAVNAKNEVFDISLATLDGQVMIDQHYERGINKSTARVDAEALLDELLDNQFGDLADKSKVLSFKTSINKNYWVDYDQPILQLSIIIEQTFGTGGLLNNAKVDLEAGTMSFDLATKSLRGLDYIRNFSGINVYYYTAKNYNAIKELSGDDAFTHDDIAALIRGGNDISVLEPALIHAFIDAGIYHAVCDEMGININCA